MLPIVPLLISACRHTAKQDEISDSVRPRSMTFSSAKRSCRHSSDFRLDRWRMRASQSHSAVLTVALPHTLPTSRHITSDADLGKAAFSLIIALQ